MSSKQISLTPESIQAHLIRLGFGAPLSLGDVTLVTYRLPARQYGGLYVLHLAGGHYYVGQSIHVFKRLTQHRQRGHEVEQLSFKSLQGTKGQRDAAEIAVIKALDAAGVPLLNVVHASISLQSSPFDDLVTPDEQRRWLDTPAAVIDVPRRSVEEHVRAKQAGKFAELQRRPGHAQIVDCLRHYVAHCIPKPRSTEAEYWSVSCLPATSVTWPRLACVTINTMEVLVVGFHKDAPQRIWAFLNLSNVALQSTYPHAQALWAAHPAARTQQLGYTAAGHDQLLIEVDGLDQVERLLHDESILRAAALFNLHLMRKRRTLYARYHCYALADLLVETEYRMCS